MSISPLHLSLPITLPNGVVIKNRIFKSAMSEQLGDSRHNPTKALAHLYSVWAQGGTGVSMTGNVMVDRTALGEPRNVVLDKKSDLESFKRWAVAGKMNNTHIWMQLNHPGKQIPKLLTKEPVAPSAVPLRAGLNKTFGTPRALTEDEIHAIIIKFGDSAELAKEAGFTGVQIHGAHGYLVNQFLSPQHNRRQDQWGGSLENRMRFVVEIYREIRKRVGKDYPVAIKLNSADFMKKGFSPEDSTVVAIRLEQEGIDLLEVSGGTYERPSMVGESMKESTLKREAYFLSFAEQLKKELRIPVVVTGGFRTAKGMNQAIESNATDMVGIARPLAVEPDFPNNLLQNDSYELHLKAPTTGFKSVDRNVMLSLTWYETMLDRIANGKSVNPNMNAWISVFQTLGRMGRYAFTQRRG